MVDRVEVFMAYRPEVNPVDAAVEGFGVLLAAVDRYLITPFG